MVLDLDETLVHASFTPTTEASITLKLNTNIYVRLRPHLANFLGRMSKIYEIVAFTASLEAYARPLLEKLDVQKVFKY